MRKIRRFLGKNRFIIALLIAFCLLDFTLGAAQPVERLTLFWKNDYEKIVLQNGTSRFDRAFYGNSAVTASYIEGDGGYANLGIDYGTVLDLLAMLKGGYVEIGSELVVGLNYLCFLDSLDTDPTYPWHRRALEPYLYFQRDRLYPFFADGLARVLRGGEFVERAGLWRFVYYGRLDDEAMAKKVGTHREQFWGIALDGYAENLAALPELIEFCRGAGIDLRAVWMPFNGALEMPETARDVQRRADEVFTLYGVEALDMTDSVPSGYFHDIGHLEYETGAPYFTELIAPWLAGGGT